MSGCSQHQAQSAGAAPGWLLEVPNRAFPQLAPALVACAAGRYQRLSLSIPAPGCRGPFGFCAGARRLAIRFDSADMVFQHHPSRAWHLFARLCNRRMGDAVGRTLGMAKTRKNCKMHRRARMAKCLFPLLARPGTRCTYLGTFPALGDAPATCHYFHAHQTDERTVSSPGFSDAAAEKKRAQARDCQGTASDGRLAAQRAALI